MKEIIILVGNIGSGKSTLVKKYQEKGYVVIARDMLRYAIGGGNYVYNTEYESIIWNTELSLLDDFLEKGINIIVDSVGINKIIRQRYIDIAKTYNYQITCFELPKISKKESVKRRMKNPHGQFNQITWEAVWDKFNNQYEKPSITEGIDFVVRMREDNNEV